MISFSVTYFFLVYSRFGAMRFGVVFFLLPENHWILHSIHWLLHDKISSRKIDVALPYTDWNDWILHFFRNFILMEMHPDHTIYIMQNSSGIVSTSSNILRKYFKAKNSIFDNCQINEESASVSQIHINRWFAICFYIGVSINVFRYLNCNYFVFFVCLFSCTIWLLALIFLVVYFVTFKETNSLQ